jgi:hypothetical protein
MSVCTIPMDVNPHVAAAAEQLGILLDDYHYSPHCRDAIVAYTVAHGTPTGAPGLDREDEHDAEVVFVAELKPVPYDSPAWDDEFVFLDAEWLAAGVHPLPFAEPDAPDGNPHLHFPGIASVAERNGLAPIAGGAPEFEPSPEDLSDYHAWAEDLDRRRDAMDMPRLKDLDDRRQDRAAVREWYRNNREEA